MKRLSLWRIRFWLLIQKARYVFKRNPMPGKYDRIYHFHIRKSAGTSINAAFWRLGGKSLADAGRDSLMVAGDYVFVRHNRDLIKAGNYHYANSHAPYWEFRLPENTFTFTVFRDPVQRLISQYRYYHFNVHHPDAHLLDPMNSNVIRFKDWLGNSFGDFLDLFPRKYLQNQLFMFSEKLDINEALENVRKLSCFYFNDELPLLIHELGSVCGQKLELLNERSFPGTIGPINPDEEAKARIKLKEELEFYNLLLLERAGSKRPVIVNQI